jgi:hypothetical protein
MEPALKDPVRMMSFEKPVSDDAHGPDFKISFMKKRGN